VVYADNVTISGRSVHVIKKNAEAVVDASKETGLEVNADTSKCMVMSRDQDAGRSHSIKTDNSKYEKVKSEVRECLLSFGAESFFFQFAIQKFKD
jgi:hypothetical protein